MTMSHNRTSVVPSNIAISVVVPTYNRAPLIRETLASIEAQTVPPAEIIVVDDGSTDDTEAVLAAFRDRIRYIKVVNGGPPQARNVGIRASSHEWIAFCDSDDLWQPSYLEKVTTLIRTVPTCQLIFSNFALFSDDGAWDRRAKFSRAPEGWWQSIAAEAVGEDLKVANSPLYIQMIQFQAMVPSAMVISKTLVDTIGAFNPAFGRNRSEDTEFVLRCVSRAPIGIVTSPMVGLRRHCENFSRDTFAVTLGRLEIMRYVLDNHRLTPEWRAAVASEISQLSVEAFDAAFARVDMDLTLSLAHSIPARGLTLARRMKVATAHLPAPINKEVTRWIQRLRPMSRLER